MKQEDRDGKKQTYRHKTKRRKGRDITEINSRRRPRDEEREKTSEDKKKEDRHIAKTTKKGRRRENANSFWSNVCVHRPKNFKLNFTFFSPNVTC